MEPLSTVGWGQTTSNQQTDLRNGVGFLFPVIKRNGGISVLSLPPTAPLTWGNIVLYYIIT